MAQSQNVKDFGVLSARADYAAAQTGTTLVAAVSGKQIVVDKCFVSADAAGNSVLLSNATKVSNIAYYGPNSGAVWDDVTMKCASGEALKYTSILSGNHSVYVEYHLEG